MEMITKKAECEEKESKKGDSLHLEDDFQTALQSCLKAILELDNQLSQNIEQWQVEAIQKFDLSNDRIESEG